VTLEKSSVEVRSHARLHVCLIDINGSMGRVDGGVGIALSDPTLLVSVRPADSLEIDYILKPFVKRFFDEFGRFNVSIKAKSVFERHVGLGSTTQLALSVCKALAELKGLSMDTYEMARVMGRGGTSGIGVSAFEGGGSLIVDGGHRFGAFGKKGFAPSDRVKASAARPLVKLSLPLDWRFVIAIPKKIKKVYGDLEVALFNRFSPIPERDVEALSRIILVKMLPSAVEADLEGFGIAINMIQKIGFKKFEVMYQGETVRELMQLGLKFGAAGAGMSSFGPAVYFLVAGDREAQSLNQRIADFSKETFIARPYDKGAETRLCSEQGVQQRCKPIQTEAVTSRNSHKSQP